MKSVLERGELSCAMLETFVHGAPCSGRHLGAEQYFIAPSHVTGILLCFLTWSKHLNQNICRMLGQLTEKFNLKSAVQWLMDIPWEQFTDKKTKDSSILLS